MTLSPCMTHDSIMKTHILHLLPIIFCLSHAAHAATLNVDQGKSRILVEAKATGHAFTGTLEKYSAKVTGDDDSLAPRSFDLTWNFQDLKTDDADRDAAMIKWLGGGKPTGSFKFEKSWTDPKGVNYAQGSLTIHGVTKTIAFPYTVNKSGNQVTIDGKVTMDYQNFNLPVVRAMMVLTVDPKLVLGFHIVGKVK